MGFEMSTRRDAGELSDNLLDVLNIILQIPQSSHVWGHFTSIARYELSKKTVVSMAI